MALACFQYNTPCAKNRPPAVFPPHNSLLFRRPAKNAPAGPPFCGVFPSGAHKKDTLLGASFNGADDQIRTDYLVLTKDALYLLSYISKKWQGQKDSNPRHVVLETTALPAELYPYITLKRRIHSVPTNEIIHNTAPFVNTFRPVFPLILYPRPVSSAPAFVIQ